MYYKHNKNISDREYLIPYVSDGKILDIGCGNGELITQIEGNKSVNKSVNKREYYGVDVNKCGLKNIHFKHQDIDEFLDSNMVKFDSIILSSSLHEIYSFKYKHLKPQVFFKEFVTKLKYHLNTNGRVIIRDGILKDKSYRKVSFKSDTRNAIDYFSTNSLYSQRNIFKMFQTKGIHLKEGYVRLPYTYECDNQSVYEFVMSYVWSITSPNLFKKETKEIFGIYNKSHLNIKGFRVYKHFEYFNPGYLRYLNQIVDHRTIDTTHQITVLVKDD